MDKEKVTLNWDGDKVKQKVYIPDQDLTPKEILHSLDHVRNQIVQFEDSLKKLEQQIEGTKKNIESAKGFENERKDFEERCIELQTERLKEIIDKISPACKGKAEKQAREMIEKDPSALTKEQMENLPYVNYQRLLATNEVIAKEIAPRLVTTLLFDKPIFDNPFLEPEPEPEKSE